MRLSPALKDMLTSQEKTQHLGALHIRFSSSKNLFGSNGVIGLSTRLRARALGAGSSGASSTPTTPTRLYNQMILQDPLMHSKVGWPIHTFRVPPEIVVCIFDTYNENLIIKNDFTKIFEGKLLAVT